MSGQPSLSKHAGPAIPRKRTIFGPEVSLAQLFLEKEYLKTQTKVLDTSIQISKIAQIITKEAFRVSDEAKFGLSVTAGTVLRAAENTRNTGDLRARQCIEKLGIRDVLSSMKMKMQLQIFSCTHSLSDQAMRIEKKMTSLSNSVRAHVIQAMDSMWLCELEKSKVGEERTMIIDEPCLAAMQEEGEEVTSNLPERANNLLANAQALEATSKRILHNCIMKSTSSMSVKATFVLQQIRNCTL